MTYRHGNGRAPRITARDKVLAMMRDTWIDTSALAVRAGVNTGGILRVTAQLVAEGLIERRGNTFGGRSGVAEFRKVAT